MVDTGEASVSALKGVGPQLEGKLATLDRARQAKEEQLRMLERKLVP